MWLGDLEGRFDDISDVILVADIGKCLWHRKRVLSTGVDERLRGGGVAEQVDVNEFVLGSVLRAILFECKGWAPKEVVCRLAAGGRTPTGGAGPSRGAGERQYRSEDDEDAVYFSDDGEFRWGRRGYQR
jgi:hypothetical protein